MQSPYLLPVYLKTALGDIDSAASALHEVIPLLGV